MNIGFGIRSHPCLQYCGRGMCCINISPILTIYIFSCLCRPHFIISVHLDSFNVSSSCLISFHNMYIIQTPSSWPFLFWFSMNYHFLIRIGYCSSQETTRNGARDSSAKAFLRPAMKRKNLHVSINSHVTKVYENRHTTNSGNIMLVL